MIRSTAVLLRIRHRTQENWRAHYHRIFIPRRRRLAFYIQSGGGGGGPKNEPPPSPVQQQKKHPYRYNRWWVSNTMEFVHQEAVIEDPDVVRERRRLLPGPTAAATWKTPKRPNFDFMLPFVRVMDYPKDPDVKHLVSVNVPRWKDHMKRIKPVVPRTWY